MGKSIDNSKDKKYLTIPTLKLQKAIKQCKTRKTSLVLPISNNKVTKWRTYCSINDIFKIKNCSMINYNVKHDELFKLLRMKEVYKRDIIYWKYVLVHPSSVQVAKKCWRETDIKHGIHQ